MRVFRQYLFRVGTKIPFPEWPGVARAFLRENGLSCGAFRYYFNVDYSASLDLALKECPALGPVRTDESNKRHPVSCLTNMMDGQGLSEEELTAHLPRIYRRYGFFKSYLIWQDIDFFSRHTETVFREGIDLPSTRMGSQMIMLRDVITPQWNTIGLFVDITHESGLLDATPYRDAMQHLLPGIPGKERLMCIFSDEEQRQYDALNERAAPLIEKAQEFLSERIPQPEDGESEFGKKLSLAGVFKKLCRQYGYEYIRYEYLSFFIRKRTENGHYIRLDIDIGRTGQEVNMAVNFTGLGFDRRVFYVGFEPGSQARAEEHLKRCFEALDAAEKKVFPALDAHYPPTPEWFVPHGYWANGIPAPGLS